MVIEPKLRSQPTCTLTMYTDEGAREGSKITLSSCIYDIAVVLQMHDRIYPFLW